MNSETIAKIFMIDSEASFCIAAQKNWQYQVEHNEVYKQWCTQIGFNHETINHVGQYPFLPISFFKTHAVTAEKFVPQIIFESSGTTTTINSKHFIKDVTIYEQSFTQAFQLFYGNIKDWCFVGLLPSYLERNNSSLVYMVNSLQQQSGCKYNGFFLHDYTGLQHNITNALQENFKVMLFGVTFALLDFAEQSNIDLSGVVIIETGGMKGRREEVTRAAVHALLQQSFNSSSIHSEYGMTELLSQAYSKGDGVFKCPPWMKVLVRSEDDPLEVRTTGKGLINIIDLANVYSCSFIATDDVGIVYTDGSFEILGRADNSDIRGCSLLTI